MIKRAFIDVETTGLSSYKNGIIQLAMILMLDNDIVYEGEFKIQPFKTDQIDQKALDVHGYQKDDILQFPDPKEVKRNIDYELRKHVDPFNKNDKFFFIGYNAKFDMDFCRSFFAKCGDKFFGSMFLIPPIDVMQSLADYDPYRWLWMSDRKLISAVKEYLPELVDSFDAHDALADIKMTYYLWHLTQNKENSLCKSQT